MSTIEIRDAGWQAIMEDERLAAARRKLSFHEIRLIVNHARSTPPLDSEAVERMRDLLREMYSHAFAEGAESTIEQWKSGQGDYERMNSGEPTMPHRDCVTEGAHQFVEDWSPKVSALLSIRTGRLPTSADVGVAKPVGGEALEDALGGEIDRIDEKLMLLDTVCNRGEIIHLNGKKEGLQFALTAMKEDDRG